MMTDKEMLAVAANQSAEDIGCKADDFFMDKNIAVPFKLGADAKKYYSLPIAANFISYGNNVVAAATDDCFDTVKEYINTFDFYHCFETPNLYWLNKRLEPKGYTVCFMAEYFLPNLNQLKELPCKYELKVLEQKDFAKLYLPELSNALCADIKELDVLGVGAYD